MSRGPGFIAALRNPSLLGALAPFRDLTSWRGWIAFHKALAGDPLDADEFERFKKHTGCDVPRAGGYEVGLALTGRQAGKSLWLATEAAFTAATAKEPGAFVTLVGQDQRATLRASFQYVKAVFDLPVFAREVVRQTQDAIELRSGVTLCCLPCRPAAVRGTRNLHAFMDEASHFTTSEGRAADREMYRALMPSLLTTKGRLVIATSPYAMSGLVYDLFKKHYAQDTGTLVWQSDSLSMHPGLDVAALERLRLEDPESAESEVEGRFRRGLSALFDGDDLDAVTVRGRRELLPVPGVAYRGFYDASGGHHDAAALCIGHRDAERIVVDLIRQWKAPHSPTIAADEASDILKSFHLREVVGDRFSAGFVVDAFRRREIEYRLAEKPASDNYLGLLPVVRAGAIELLDAPGLLRELRQLERRRGTAGRDRLDHPAHGFDDQAAALAGLVSLLPARARVVAVVPDFMSGRDDDDDDEHDHAAVADPGGSLSWARRSKLPSGW